MWTINNIVKILNLTYPDAMAPTIAIPSAADLPLPLGAISATMLSGVLSRIVSRKIETAFP